jgi:hypothetical protein
MSIAKLTPPSSPFHQFKNKIKSNPLFSLLCGDKSQQTRGKYTFTHICQILIVIRSFFFYELF